MSRLTAALGAVAAIAVLAMSAAVMAADTPRISFQIATGSTTGTFFPVGEAIAGLISHPPGVNRCETANVCGPAGLIVSARTSDGTIDNLLSVNDGGVESGLAQSDVIAAAVKGVGLFKAKGKQSHVRVIASLFSEEVHLVVSEKANIKKISDLRGKRVSLGLAGSGVGFTAREILTAYRVPEAKLKLVSQDTMGAIGLMKQGKLDAFFAVGGVPIAGVGDLLSSRSARLLPITGPVRDRLAKSEPSLEIATITYPGQEPVATVSTRALWIVRDSVPENLVYGITRALFNPANREAISASHPSAREIALNTAALMPPAALHPGAARFYAEASRAAQR
ncbi:MAG: TAXI family TRAP transporter solute-binding subunit [Rhizomicrobium sp.]